MSVLRFANVSKLYGLSGQSVTALSDVTVEIDPGEFVALIGRSGCGKSTFLNLAGAMDLPTHGEVHIGGVSTARMGDAELTAVRREQVGFIFQFFQLLPTLSAVENVELPLQLASQPRPRHRALELMELVGLNGLGDRLPYQLSGGQMQRVAVARALVHSPAVLLADEPIGNLDTETSSGILDLLQHINTDLGTTIVMATHSRDSAGRAGRILRLSDGRLSPESPTRPV